MSRTSMLSHEWGRNANPYWQRVFYALDGAQTEVEVGSRRWLELSEAKTKAIELAHGCPKQRLGRAA